MPPLLPVEIRQGRRPKVPAKAASRLLHAGGAPPPRRGTGKYTSSKF